MAASSSSNDPTGSAPRPLDWVVAGVAGVAVAASLALAGSVLAGGTGNVSSARALRLPAVTAKERAEPSVLTSGFVGLPLAEHDRDVLVGIGAHPGGPLDVVVIPSDESVVSPDDVGLHVGGASATGSAAVSCGDRCLRFPLRTLAGSPTAFSVTVRRSGKPSTVVRFRLPARLPPPAGRLFRIARARMLELRSLALHESLGSGLAAPVVSTWSFHAPDRFQYAIVGGPKAVVVGARRWDWGEGRWTPSTSSPVRVPTYPWQDARGAHLLRRSTIAGNPVRVLAFVKPGVAFPTWFLLYVRDDGYAARVRMMTTGHFMVDDYDAYDTAAPIRPPA